jgi:acyl transferase domain-containing protein
VVDALDLARVSADSVGYVECHSTGTIVGDPLEIEALTMAFRKGTKRTQYCAVGSVKANIGHPGAGGGIAGLIKPRSCCITNGCRPASIMKRRILQSTSHRRHFT